jgi:molecular chaperone IbpA
MLAHLHRNAVGFDRMFEDLHRSTNLSQTSDKYPPHDIIKYDDNNYSINLAVAGFSEEELDITIENNILSISGSKSANRSPIEYIHQGISTRGFNKVFNLAEHATVKDAKYENGLLIIGIEIEVPEALKPRKIGIKTTVVGHVSESMPKLK